MKVGCFTPVKDRQLFLRACLMQMHLQTRRPDAYIVLLNGMSAAKYDQRCIEDLQEPWIDIKCEPRQLTTLEASTIALERLLRLDIDIFFKVDSDDVYFRTYISEFIGALQTQGVFERPNSFCANLIHQYWWNALACGGATINRVHFLKGLGLRADEEARGVKVGAPPTFCFNRSVAELLVAQGRRPPYNQIPSDDQAWRTILIDHGIVIDQIRTENPVFGYLRHTGNTSQIRTKSAKSQA
jgi:hypothetical protein